MDWQLSVMGPSITPVFWGLIRTPPEKRDANAIAAGKEKTIAAAKIMDAQLGKTAYLAGDAFSYGDIPVGIMIYRYMQLIPGAAGDAESRPLVCGDLVAAGVQGAGRGRAAVVAERPTAPRRAAASARRRSGPRPRG